MSTLSKLGSTYLEFQTPHYTFQMKITGTNNTYLEYHFIVGDEKSPCLEGQITLDYNKNNDRYRQYENVAYLHKIEALEECALEDITEEYALKHSFGKELLDAIVFFINSQFQKVKTVKLTDKSYIPCDRANGDTLDLLTYSIALYKKTWYEERLNAYMMPLETYSNYRKEVERYASKEVKEAVPFELFLDIHVYKQYPKDILMSQYEYYKSMYETSETFPQFFQNLTKTIKREEKCKFFKDWLEKFIYSYVKLGDRTWYFDLYPKITLIEQVNMKTIPSQRNKTRKQRRK